MRKCRELSEWAMLAAACGWLAGTTVYAQDQQGGEPPKPPARAYGPLGVDDQQDQQNPTADYQPDTRPMTGFQQPTVGTPTERHSYWVPGVSYYNYIQSNGDVLGGGSDWHSTSSLSGNVTLLENWRRSQLTLNLSGGGSFSTDDAVGNGWFQQ